jgi:nucleoside phosphorylase
VPRSAGVIDTIFVPEGLEARVVRDAVEAAGAPISVIAMGIGSERAAEVVSRALYGARIERALITGVCGLLAPHFHPGEALLYADVRSEKDPSAATDRNLTTTLASMLTRPRSGIRALSWSSVVTTAREKGQLAGRYDADAVDMESYAALSVLRGAGVTTAVMRVGSDAAGDDLPEVNRALVNGVLDGRRLAFQMLRAPREAAGMAWHGMLALMRLKNAVSRIARGRTS